MTGPVVVCSLLSRSEEHGHLAPQPAITHRRPVASEYWSARSGKRMMGRMVERRDFLYAACLRWLWAVWTNPGSPGSAVQAGTAEPAGAAIAVGSFDFPDSVLLACIYTEALATKGFPVPVLPGLGAGELVHRALMNGLVQLVPEHAGSALELVSRGRRTQALIPERRGGQ